MVVVTLEEKVAAAAEVVVFVEGQAGEEILVKVMMVIELAMVTSVEAITRMMGSVVLLKC